VKIIMGEPVAVLTQEGLVRAEQLKFIVERVESLESQKKGLMEDIRETYKQAKEENMDVKTIKRIVKLRGMDEKTIQEEEILLEAYKSALGMG